MAKLVDFVVHNILLISHRRHMMTHTDEKPHVCEECDSAYKTLDALQRHQRSVALLTSIHTELKMEVKAEIFTVRKRSCGKVMFSQACVKNSVHMVAGWCVCVCLPDTPSRQTPPGQTPALGRHSPTPGRRPLQRTVRILLECILFFDFLSIIL